MSIKPKSRQGGCIPTYSFCKLSLQPTTHPQAGHNSTDPSVKMDKTIKQLTAAAHHKKTLKERHSVLHTFIALLPD